MQIPTNNQPNDNFALAYKCKSESKVKSYRQSKIKGYDISILCFEETERFGALEGKMISLTDS